MNLSPLVSICIPSYNGMPFIIEAINSAIQQTYENIEIIIADDQSTDATRKALDALSDPRIIFHKNEVNLGLAKNYQNVLSLARGEYVCFLSQDDLIKPEFIHWAVGTLEAHPKAAFAFCATEFIGKRQGSRVLPFPSVLSGDSFINTSLTKASNLVFQCGAVARRALLTEIGIEDILFFDWTLWLRAALRGDICYTPSTLAIYRYHEQNTTKKLNYFEHFTELSTSVIKFKDSEILTKDVATLVMECVFLLWKRYLSLLSQDKTVPRREFLRQFRSFWRFPAPFSMKITRIPRALLKRYVTEIRRNG